MHVDLIPAYLQTMQNNYRISRTVLLCEFCCASLSTKFYTGTYFSGIWKHACQFYSYQPKIACQPKFMKQQLGDTMHWFGRICCSINYECVTNYGVCWLYSHKPNNNTETTRRARRARRTQCVLCGRIYTAVPLGISSLVAVWNNNNNKNKNNKNALSSAVLVRIYTAAW